MKVEEASIPLTNLIICIIYLLPYIITWLGLTAYISLPILEPLFRFLEQLSRSLWYLYWGAAWGESVHAGEPAAGRSTGACRTGAVQQASSATNSTQGRLNALNKTSNQRRKRKRKGDEEDEPPDQKAKLDPGNSSSPFACPFYLHDRHECHNCLRNYTLNRIVDVRLHLYRVHVLAPQCPICGEEFKGDTAEDRFNTHIQRQNCQPLPFPPSARLGITRDQLEAIQTSARHRSGRRAADPAAEKWFEMWDIIFPGTTRPISPYIRDHPDVQRIMDMTQWIFSGERWRDVILPDGENSPSLQTMSRRTLSAIADGLIAVYRRIYQDLDPRAPEATANAVADTPVTSSMDDSLQQRHGWEVLSAPSQPAQATGDPLLPGSLATAATGQDPWVLEEQHRHLPLDAPSHNDPVTQVSQALSSFTSDLDFLTDEHMQESIFSFPDVVDSFDDPVRSGSPSQVLNNDYRPNTSGFWGHQGGSGPG